MRPLRLRDERGVTAVEFALVYPLALLFIFSILYTGLRAWTAVVAHDAARDGARYASVRASNSDPFPSDAQIAAYVAANESPDWLPAPVVTVTSQGSGGGSQVTVEVSYEDLGFLNSTGMVVRALATVFGDDDASEVVDDVARAATVRRE